MGDEERAQMYLQLEKVVKELKELRWKIDQMHSFLSELDLFLRPPSDALDRALSILEKPENKQWLNLEATIELLRTTINLETKKRDLEKKLGTRVTLE